MPFDTGRMLSLLAPDGPLAIAFKEFECREQQRQMMDQVVGAYQKNEVALIEAETGTGKSIAYLIPALYWAVEKKERTLISTHTIALQEQLLQKDIPMLLKALGIELSVVLAKGMGQYLCLRRLQEEHQEPHLLSDTDKIELEKIEDWAQATGDGSFSDLPFATQQKNWERVSAESDTCTGRKCPFYERCFFFKARRAAAEAQIVIVNHHLLLADLAMRIEDNNYDQPALLPPSRRLIIDEAHHLEDVATETLANRLNYLQLVKVMARIGSEKQGKLAVLKENIQKQYLKQQSVEAEALLKQLHLDLALLKRELQIQVEDTFQIIQFFIESRVDKKTGENDQVEFKGQKLRLTSAIKQELAWKKELLPAAQRLIDLIGRFTQSLQSFVKGVQQLKNDALEQATVAVRKELSAMAERIIGYQGVLEKIIREPMVENCVQWAELALSKSRYQIHLISAELNLSDTLVKTLFRPMQTVVMCSATLTTNQQFGYMRQRLGLLANQLPDRRISEQQYPSPFNYAKQALLLVPNNLPEPHEKNYLEAICEQIRRAVQASQGNAFILFTSYHLLNNCFEKLAPQLRAERYFPLKHGEGIRNQLLKKFREVDRSVLFGTYSFWEGVDIPGEALRCVIIPKLPFKVPSEPLFAARAEAIALRGGDPFQEYALPQAILKFKQGFGRLIRKKRDRGCVVCLDSRLIKRSYGSLFLHSLPASQQLILPSEELYLRMADFYRKTYALTKAK